LLLMWSDRSGFEIRLDRDDRESTTGAKFITGDFALMERLRCHSRLIKSM
jgi:hypothetical protein